MNQPQVSRYSKLVGFLTAILLISFLQSAPQPALAAGNPQPNAPTWVSKVSASSYWGNTVSLSYVGTWDPNEILAYKWFLDTTVVSTEATYTTKITDVGKYLTAEVTGSLPGYDDVVLTSYASRVDGPMLQSLANCSLSPQGGQVYRAYIFTNYTASIGFTMPGLNVSYKWFSTDGQNIEVVGTDSSYKIRPEDAGRDLWYEANFSALGYISGLCAGDVGRATLNLAPLVPTPVIKGSFQVGKPLTVDEGDWGRKVTFSYKWYRWGTLLSTSKTYTPTTDDIWNGTVFNEIFVDVLGDAVPGYAASGARSQTYHVTKAVFSSMPAPSISGVAKVKSTLSANTSGWDPAAKLSFQWLIDNKAVKGATTRSFKLTSAAKGHKISFKVTATANGYNDAVRVSKTIKVG